MKNIAFLLIALFGIFFSSCNVACNEDGEKFLGTWKSGERNVIKIGRTDLLIFCNYWVDVSTATRGGSSYNSHEATYDDGALKFGKDIAVSYSNGNIIYEGIEYEKSN